MNKNEIGHVVLQFNYILPHLPQPHGYVIHCEPYLVYLCRKDAFYERNQSYLLLETMPWKY